MSLRNGLTSAIAFATLALLAATGCSANVEAGDVPATEEATVNEQAISGDGAGSTDTSTGTVAEKPKCDRMCVYNACMSSCRKDHLSRGWCDSYCFCIAVGLGGSQTCANVASDTFIDI